MLTDLLRLWQSFVSDNLSAVWDATLLFLLSAMILFVMLSAVQYYIERRRRSVFSRKEQYVSQLYAYIVLGRKEIAVNDAVDHFAFVDAVAEVSGSLSAADRKRLRDLTMALETDTYLLVRYLKSRMTLIRIFLFTKMLSLHSPRLKPFFEQMMKKRSSFDIMEYAVYGFAEYAQTQEDLEKITKALLAAYDRGISLKFSEFVYVQALKSMPYRELEAFLAEEWFRRVSMVMIRSIVAAMGDTKNEVYVPLLNKLYRLHRSDDSFVITYIRALHKIGASECDVIRKSYVSMNPVIRIVCAKTGLDLCKDTALEFLYIYFFDENYYVRRNIFEMCEKHGISRRQIMETVMRKAPWKINDAFFIDSLKALYPQRGEQC